MPTIELAAMLAPAQSLAASPQMWLVLALTAFAAVFYVTEWIALEVTSLVVLMGLLVLIQLFPAGGLTVERLLAGFGNPALITVLALLVVGEALVQTGALDGVASQVQRLPLPPVVTLAFALLVVAVLSAFLNNTPVVVIFIPILQALANRAGINASRVMMPLSFAAILGGMTTLIGSSTNLLVSSALIDLQLPGLGFFEFSLVGGLLAGAGILYLMLVAPWLLPDRSSLSQHFTGGGQHFLAQIILPGDSPLVGERAVAGRFKSLPDMTVHMVLRGDRAEYPPFDEVDLQPRDILVVAATRRALADAAARHPGLLHPPVPEEAGGADRLVEEGDGKVRAHDEGETPLLVEAMVGPSSRIVGFTLRQVGFRQRYGVVVLGIQRRSRMLRGPLRNIRFEPGDVLLLQGRSAAVDALRNDRDLVLISGSASTLPRLHHAGRAALVFLGAVGAAALGLVPIVVAALGAATLLLVMGTINLRQASRALDRRIILLVAAALGLGAALQATGGAQFLAMNFLSLFHGAGTLPVLSGYFLMVAVFTNLLSNNACAVLFTPIGVGLAVALGVDPHMFAIATVLAANASFATPIGYQTNLLVLGPGHYRFSDFLRVGLPLTLLVWVLFTLAAPLFWQV